MDMVDASKKSILKQLEREGLRNILCTDCFRQRDENAKKDCSSCNRVDGNMVTFSQRREEKLLPDVHWCAKCGESSLINAGVLPPRIENIETGMKLALCGTILEHLVGEDITANYLLFSLNRLERFGNITVQVPYYTAAAYD